MYSVCNASSSIHASDVQSCSVAVGQFQPSASCAPTTSANLAFAPTSYGSRCLQVGGSNGAAASLCTSSVLALVQSSMPQLQVTQSAYNALKPLHSQALAAETMHSGPPAIPRNACKEDCSSKNQSNSCYLPETSPPSPGPFYIACSIRSSLPSVFSLPAGVSSTAPSAECSGLNLLDQSVSWSTLVKNVNILKKAAAANRKDPSVKSVTSIDSLAASYSSSITLEKTKPAIALRQTKDCSISQNCNCTGSRMPPLPDELKTGSKSVDGSFPQIFLVPKVQLSTDNSQHDSDALSGVAQVSGDLCIAEPVSAVAANELSSNFSSTDQFLPSHSAVLLTSTQACRSDRHYLDGLIPLKLGNELSHSNDQCRISSADSAIQDKCNSETCNSGNEDFTDQFGKKSNELQSPFIHSLDTCSDSYNVTCSQNTAVNARLQSLSVSDDSGKIRYSEPVLSHMLISHFNDNTACITGKTTTVGPLISSHHWAADISSTGHKNSPRQDNQLHNQQPSFAFTATSGKPTDSKKKIAVFHQKEAQNVCQKSVSEVCCETSSRFIVDNDVIASEYCSSSQVAECINVTGGIDDRVNGLEVSEQRQKEPVNNYSSYFSLTDKKQCSESRNKRGRGHEIGGCSNKRMKVSHSSVVHDVGRKKLATSEMERKIIAAAAAARLKEKMICGKSALAVAASGDRSFIQDGLCSDVGPLVIWCRECLMTETPLCRFNAFRRLRKSARLEITHNGFLHPHDASVEDLFLWMPSRSGSNQLTVKESSYILSHVADVFHYIVELEVEAMSWCRQSSESVIWKRPLRGVRELCDLCCTTLFNVHWICPRCGYAVCMDCFCSAAGLLSNRRGRHAACAPVDQQCALCRNGGRRWHSCTATNGEQHVPQHMLLTQIIPSDAVSLLRQKLIDINNRFQQARCESARAYKKSSSADADHWHNGMKRIGDYTAAESVNCNAQTSCLSRVSKLVSFMSPKIDTLNQRKIEPIKPLEESLFSDIKDACWGRASALSAIPVSPTAPDVKYEYLDDGGVLQLYETSGHDVLDLFRLQWQKAAPVVVAGCQRYLDSDLWRPESFCSEFGSRCNELVDCTNDVLLIGHKMRVFWDGFESMQSRLRDRRGQRLILKLKDWPPTEDIAELMPERYDNLLEALPFPEYTHRTGAFNLVSRLPDFFVPPDLGPKLYVAYGSALHPKIGSTNLHLDISDAANLMLYVGVPVDDARVQERAVIRAMELAGCCDRTMARVREHGEIPGALWHIYDPNDSDKIRQLLLKVAEERGEIMPQHHDPIHDQSWYLDELLRERLWREYGVRGYTIVQFYGDTVFIPAGAAHQVRNLHSCIKAAEDFVSPENLSHCLTMMQQFRHLSDTHSNHEDKLQIKNVVYHTVKDVVAVLEKAGIQKEH